MLHHHNYVLGMVSFQSWKPSFVRCVDPAVSLTPVESLADQRMRMRNSIMPYLDTNGMLNLLKRRRWVPPVLHSMCTYHRSLWLSLLSIYVVTTPWHIL